MYDAIFFKLEEKLILIEASINLITRNSYVLFYYYVVPLSIEAQICINSLLKNVGWRQFYFIFFILESKRQVRLHFEINTAISLLAEASKF